MKWIKGLVILTITLALVFSATTAYSQALQGRYVQVELKALASATAGDGVGSTISMMDNFRDAIIVMNLQAQTAQNSATLNVKLQSQVAGVWVDIAGFAEQRGDQSVVSQVMQWTSTSVTTALRNLSSANKSIAAGTVSHGPVGPLWRVAWVTANASTGSWRFGITGFFRD